MNLRISSGALLALLALDVSRVNAFAPSSCGSSSMTASPSPSQKHGSSRTSQLNVASSLPLNGFQPNTNNGLEVVDSNDQNDSKIGVLLLNLGGPEKTEDVEGASFFGELCQWLDVGLRLSWEKKLLHNGTEFQHKQEWICLNLLLYSSLPIPKYRLLLYGYILSVSLQKLWHLIFARNPKKLFLRKSRFLV